MRTKEEVLNDLTNTNIKLRKCESYFQEATRKRDHYKHEWDGLYRDLDGYIKELLEVITIENSIAGTMEQDNPISGE